MRIEAAGKTWIVEEQGLPRASWVGADRFSGVTFRNADYDADELQVRWVLRPDRLTPGLARELFDIAGVRIWRDPRDGRTYRLQLESNPFSPSDGGPAALGTIRFEAQDFSGEAPWTVSTPLGCASDQELMRLLERARNTGTGRLRED